MDAGDGQGEGRNKMLSGLDLINSEGCGEGSMVLDPFVQPHSLASRDIVEEELQRMTIPDECNDRVDDDVEARRQFLTLNSDTMTFKAAIRMRD